MYDIQQRARLGLGKGNCRHISRNLNVYNLKYVPLAVIFDPASFYGHHEFDLAIAAMFGGFTQEFYDAYHRLVPKSPGFVMRHKLYLLFHYLNHWYIDLALKITCCVYVFLPLGTIMEQVTGQKQSP